MQLFKNIIHKISDNINRKPSQMKKLSKSGQYQAKKTEHKKSSVRAKTALLHCIVWLNLQYCQNSCGYCVYTVLFQTLTLRRQVLSNHKKEICMECHLL